MNKAKLYLLALTIISLASCVSKSRFNDVQSKLDQSQEELYKCGTVVDDFNEKLNTCKDDLTRLENQAETYLSNLKLREEQIADLKDQISDYRKQRDMNAEQVGNLTVLSQSANENINQTLAQLEQRDQYIRLLQAAKTKADSINLALSANLKGELADGLFDDDVNVKVDKTVVMINLSDKMLFSSGSTTLNSNAMGVLGKIAKIIKGRPDIEVMVEGYTDNLPIAKPGIIDNWDLSVKRATSVVRVLQKNFGINPNKMIAAGRGEFNALTSNDTAEGRSANRRTRIIIMPKLDQFYDLLDPNKLPK